MGVEVKGTIEDEAHRHVPRILFAEERMKRKELNGMTSSRPDQDPGMTSIRFVATSQRKNFARLGGSLKVLSSSSRAVHVTKLTARSMWVGAASEEENLAPATGRFGARKMDEKMMRRCHLDDTDELSNRWHSHPCFHHPTRDLTESRGRTSSIPSVWDSSASSSWLRTRNGADDITPAL